MAAVGDIININGLSNRRNFDTMIHLVRKGDDIDNDLDSLPKL